MTVSVTPFGIVGPGLVTSTPSLSGGQSAATPAVVPRPSMVATSAAAETDRIAVVNALVMVIFESPFCLQRRRLRDIGCKIAEMRSQRKYRLPPETIAVGYRVLR